MSDSFDFPFKSLLQHDAAARPLLVADRDAYDGGDGDGFVPQEDGFEFGRRPLTLISSCRWMVS
jgi:hypothetical protein